MTLTVDATDAPRRLLHARATIPAPPGPLTLRYPKWIPGEHGPTGPVVDVAGLVIRAGGKPLEWRRDEVDLYAVHVTVPAGANSVDVSFDYLAPAERESYSSGGSTTAELVALEWNLVLIYPDGVNQRDLVIAPKLTLPHGWKLGTALETARQSGDTTEFKPVSLETLVDSPVIAGAFFRSWPLGTVDGVVHTLDAVADSEGALAIEPEQLDEFKRLVVEAGLLFGTRHYQRYHFLLTLSDKVAHFGLEHHQSSDNRTRERFLIEEGPRKLSSGLLPHEFVHSWNGKFRRPAGLAVDGFDKPMHGDLLWVYEGLTSYLGWVLAARSGLEAPEWAKEELALTAAQMETRSGRQWRPLEDTALAASILRSSPEWGSWRRSLDYYPEGVLLWLDADVTIRALTGGKKSLDDFCRLFHGGANKGAEVKPYTLDDVVSALNTVAPHDWRGFIHARVQAVAPHAPLGGITGGGWKVVYTDKANERAKTASKVDKTESFVFSLGFTLKEDGYVSDVLPNSPAFKAGLGPAMRIIGVDGRKLTHDSLPDALKAHLKDGKPLELLLFNSDYYKTIKIDYRAGEQNPHLARENGKPDVLQQITKPLQNSSSPTK